MTPCTCDKWMERKAMFEIVINMSLAGFAERQEWTCCPWCGCLLIPLIDPKASLSGSEKPREEAIIRTDDEIISASKTAFDLENVNVTTSFIQRRFRIGFNRAQAIVSEIQRRGLIPKRPPFQPNRRNDDE